MIRLQIAVLLQTLRRPAACSASLQTTRAVFFNGFPYRLAVINLHFGFSLFSSSIIYTVNEIYSKMMTGWMPILKVLLLNSWIPIPLTFIRQKLKHVMHHMIIILFSHTEMCEVLERCKSISCPSQSSEDSRHRLLTRPAYFLTYHNLQFYPFVVLILFLFSF